MEHVTGVKARRQPESSGNQTDPWRVSTGGVRKGEEHVLVAKALGAGF
jgi:hypothetical protein